MTKATARIEGCSIPAIMPNDGVRSLTFGMFVAALPLANQDLETLVVRRPGEPEDIAAYLRELAAYLRHNMSGHDFEVLKSAMDNHFRA